jgi:hypothetical protein
MWGGTYVYPDTVTTQVVDATYGLMTRQDEDPNIAFWHSFAHVPSYNMTINSVQPMYLEPVEAPPTAFNALLDIPPMTAKSRVDWMSSFTDEIEAMSPFGVRLVEAYPSLMNSALISNPDRNMYSTISFYPSREVMLEILDIYREEVESIKPVEGALSALAFQPVNVGSMEKMRDRGGNAIGLELDNPLTSKRPPPCVFFTAIPSQGAFPPTTTDFRTAN